MTTIRKRLGGSAALLLATACLTNAQIVPIPAGFALPKATLDTTAPGFVVRLLQANMGSGELPNLLSRTEAQLAGLLIDPATGVAYANDADLSLFELNLDGSFNETVAIDYGGAGAIPFPGMPGINGAVQNIAMEALTFLDLEAGTYSMVVNSDDGFRVSVGSDSRDKLNSINLGAYDGGRGAGDTAFQFSVAQAGAYSFRLIYEQGGGDYSVSWFGANTNAPDTRILVNAEGVEGGIKAYRKLTTALPAHVDFVSPSPGAEQVSPGVKISARIKDGSTSKVTVGSVKLYLDHSLVSGTVTSDANGTMISYDPPGLLKVLTKHTVGLIFSDNATPPNVRSNSWVFTVSNNGNVALPTPIYYENFESIEETSLPEGWTVQNFTTGASGEYDLDNPGSDSYLDWVTITTERVLAIGTSGRWEGTRRTAHPEMFVNDIPISGIASNKFIYAESDTRGGSQIQYLFTKDYDLTGKTDLFVAYYSMYEQNQDSIGSVEYSIDGGTSWLPIVYMIDVPDIVLAADGTKDAVATFTKVNGDTAINPIDESLPRTFGAFIGAAKDTWANLGPYISGRLDDNYTESKRVELFPISKANNQKTVRFRFAQAGTGSWYFGFDNFGIYSISTPILVAPLITSITANSVLVKGEALNLKATVTGSEPLTYQWMLNGVDIAGATTNTYNVAAISAADAGKYTVTIRNEKGAASSDITVTVIEGDADFKKGLVAHLKFDDTLTDSSGRNNGGTAVGTINYVPGKLGGKAAQYKSIKDGSSFNYITLGTPADLDFGLDVDFTIAFWGKLVTWTGDPSFIGNKDWNSGSNPGYVLASDGDGRIQWNIAGTAAGIKGDRKDYDGPAGTFSDLGWHHVAVSFTRAGTADTYVDGTLRDSRAISTPPNNLSTPAGKATNIGQDGTGSYTDGGGVEAEAAIDDLGIWRRALNANEIGALYKKGQAGLDITTDPITVGLVSHLTFDGDLKDSSGRNNHGTAVGDVPFVAGRLGSQAIRTLSIKDGSSFNYVTLGNPADLNFGTSVNFSLAFWAKLETWSGDPSFIGNKNWNSGSNRGYVLATDNDGRLQWNIAGVGDANGSRKDYDGPAGTFSDKGWHHVVVTFNRSGTADTYVDGSLRDSRSITTPPNNLATPDGQATNIGQDGTGTYTDGGGVGGDMMIDDVGIWNRVITAGEVGTIYMRAQNGKNIAGNAPAAITAPTISGVTVSGDTVTIRWTGTGTYQLQKRDAFGSGSWVNAGTPVTGNSTTNTVGGSTSFYRLIAQ